MSFFALGDSVIEPSRMPRAALITYWCDGVYGCRRIIQGNEAREYVKDVAGMIASTIKELVLHHRNYVNASELEILQEIFGNESNPDSNETWDYQNVLELLKTLPEIALAEYESKDSTVVADSYWYQQLIGFLNDEFPHSDGVWINFEGPMSEFLSELLKFETESYKSINDLTDVGAAWLGTVAVLSQLSWKGDVSMEQRQAVFKVLKTFNDDNSEIYSLK